MCTKDLLTKQSSNVLTTYMHMVHTNAYKTHRHIHVHSHTYTHILELCKVIDVLNNLTVVIILYIHIYIHIQIDRYRYIDLDIHTYII